MSSEKPVRLKRCEKEKKYKKRKKMCILHNANLKNQECISTFSEQTWRRVTESKTFYEENENIKSNVIKICDELPLNLDDSRHGYHKSCYACFIDVKKNSMKRKNDNAESGCSRPKRVCSETKVLFDKDKCIFCERQYRYNRRKREILTKCVTEIAKTTIAEAARYANDTRMIALTENNCLIAQEAYYHSACRKNYTRNHERHTQNETSTEHIECQQAHNQAFDFIVKYVQEAIVDNGNVVRLSMITDKYQTYMESNFKAYYNPHYRSQKLKEKLESKFGEKIVFWSQNQSRTLVFSSNIETGEAVETVFEEVSSDKKRLKEAAILLRNLILKSFHSSTELPWPPSSHFLLSNIKTIPDLLISFITQLLY